MQNLMATACLRFKYRIKAYRKKCASFICTTPLKCSHFSKEEMNIKEKFTLRTASTIFKILKHALKGSKMFHKILQRKRQNQTRNLKSKQRLACYDAFVYLLCWNGTRETSPHSFWIYFPLHGCLLWVRVTFLNFKTMEIPRFFYAFSREYLFTDWKKDQMIEILWNSIVYYNWGFQQIWSSYDKTIKYVSKLLNAFECVYFKGM